MADFIYGGFVMNGRLTSCLDLTLLKRINRRVCSGAVICIFQKAADHFCNRSWSIAGQFALLPTPRKYSFSFGRQALDHSWHRRDLNQLLSNPQNHGEVSCDSRTSANSLNQSG